MRQKPKYKVGDLVYVITYTTAHKWIAGIVQEVQPSGKGGEWARGTIVYNVICNGELRIYLESSLDYFKKGFELDHGEGLL